MIFGALSDDSRTICSYLQRQINEEKKDYLYNYLRLYSIQRTSLNGTPLVKIVKDIKLK